MIHNILINFFCLLIGIISVNAQSSVWKKEKTKNGQIDVWSKIDKQVDGDGKQVQLIEYKCFTTTNKASKEQIAAVLKNAGKHKAFMANTEESRDLGIPGPNQWLVYYFIDTPWPMPNSDCVAKFKIENFPDENKTIVTGQAVPEAYPDQGIRRMQFSRTVYTIQELDNGLIYLEIWSKFRPATAAPKWLVSSWFPKGPGGILERLIALAGE